MRFLISPGTEDGRTYPHHGAATGDGIGKIIGHTHRHNINGYIIVFFCPYVNRKVAHFLKKFVIICRILANWGDSHETTHMDICKFTHSFENVRQFFLMKTGLAFLISDIDFQKDILNEPLSGGLSVHGFQKPQRVHRVDQADTPHHLLDLVGLQMPDEMHRGT